MIRLIVLMLLACLTYQSEAAKKYLGKNPGPVSRRLNSFVDYGSIKNVDYGSIKKDQLNKLESQLSHLGIKLFIQRCIEKNNRPWLKCELHKWKYPPTFNGDYYTEDIKTKYEDIYEKKKSSGTICTCTNEVVIARYLYSGKQCLKLEKKIKQFKGKIEKFKKDNGLN